MVHRMVSGLNHALTANFRGGNTISKGRVLFAGMDQEATRQEEVLAVIMEELRNGLMEILSKL